MAWNDFLSRNSDAFLQSGLGLLSGQTGSEQAAMGAKGFADARKQNKTLQYLQQYDPELAQLAESGGLPVGDALKLAYQRKAAASDPATQLDLEYKRARIAELGRSASGQGAAEYGLNPQYGTDAAGNPVLLQLSKNGTVKQTALPDGVSLSKEPIKLDAGTHFVLLDPITRQPIGQIPKNLAEAESQKAQGKAEGDAIGGAAASAPSDLQAAVNAKSLIQDIRTDPYLERGTGLSAMGNSLPGTGGYDFQNKVDQAKSGAFLSAIQQMRGLGALSNAEGGAATAAVTRMNTSTSKEAFNAALNDYERIIDQGLAKAQSKMNGRSLLGPQPAQGNNYKSKYGLD
jgi:hypothetical protein